MKKNLAAILTLALLLGSFALAESNARLPTMLAEP